MTKEQILKKAIERAVKNGLKKTSVPCIMINVYDLCGGMEECFNIIFNHDFAKAFWKTKKFKTITVKRNTYDWEARPPKIIQTTKFKRTFRDGKSWQSHLQQMVLSKDPIKYLEKHL